MSLAVNFDEVGMLRSQLASAWAEIQTLRRTIAHQARLLEHLGPETHPAAPSLNCVYWKFSLAHEHGRSWLDHRNRLLPTLKGLGTLPAPEVTPIRWAEHVAQRRHEHHRYGKPPCDYTLDIELGRAKGLLDWAVENQMIAFNPLRGAKRSGAKSRRETDLKPYDVDAMLEAARDVTDKRLCDGDDDGLRAKKLSAFILCCFRSMLRRNEARFLRRGAIRPNGDVDVIGKGRKKRTVTLTADTLEAIAAIPVHPKSDYVFASETGKPHGSTTFHSWFRWACEHGRLDSRAAPGERVVIHSLRHAGATAADAAGVRPGALQQVMGHASLETTERYLHRDAIESAHHVAELMSPRRPPRRTKK